MLRTFIFYLIYLPATGFLAALCNIVPPWSPRIGQIWGTLAVRLAGLRMNVDLSALDPRQNYVFMVNHQSQLDIAVIYMLLGRGWHIGFVAKHTLKRIPLFGWAMLHAGSLFIDRTNTRRAMRSIDEAAKKARDGIAMIVYPDGTRATDLSKLQPYKTGGMIIALKTGLPIAPIVITGTGDAMPKGSIRVRSADVSVRALTPIEPSRYTLKERNKLKDDLYDIMNKAYLEQRNG